MCAQKKLLNRRERSCPAIRQCIALAMMEGTGQPREAGKAACHFRNFMMSAPEARQWKPVPL